MKQHPRIVICGNYGATNIGDEAIFQSILECILKTFPQAHIQVVSAKPEESAARYGVEAVPKIPAGFRSFFKAIFGGGLRKTLKAYKQADVVLFGGGGLFSDERPHAIFIWLMQILPAFWYKKPVMSFGQSIGPLFMRTSRWTVKKIFKRIKIISVRDYVSKDYLEKLGIRNVHVLPDPVFGLDMSKISHHSRERKPYIVFSLRPWISHAAKHGAILAEFIDWIYETYHLQTHFIPFQYDQDDDGREMMKVFSKLEQRDAAEVFSFNESISEVIQLIQQSTLLIGMRLHSLIFAALTHTPFLGLSYSRKVSDVASQLGMDDYVCEYRFIDLEQLKKKFEKLFSERAHLEKAIAEKQKLFAEKTLEYSALLQELVASVKHA